MVSADSAFSLDTLLSSSVGSKRGIVEFVKDSGISGNFLGVHSQCSGRSQMWNRILVLVKMENQVMTEITEMGGD
jgi:hypothetical protein